MGLGVIWHSKINKLSQPQTMTPWVVILQQKKSLPPANSHPFFFFFFIFVLLATIHWLFWGVFFYFHIFGLINIINYNSQIQLINIMYWLGKTIKEMIFSGVVVTIFIIFIYKENKNVKFNPLWTHIQVNFIWSLPCYYDS
jgi:hypothetical protein